MMNQHTDSPQGAPERSEGATQRDPLAPSGKPSPAVEALERLEGFLWAWKPSHPEESFVAAGKDLAIIKTALSASPLASSPAPTGTMDAAYLDWLERVGWHHDDSVQSAFIGGWRARGDMPAEGPAPTQGPDELESSIRRHYTSSSDHHWLGHLLGIIDGLRTSTQEAGAQAVDLEAISPSLGASDHLRHAEKMKDADEVIIEKDKRYWDTVRDEEDAIALQAQRGEGGEKKEGGAKADLQERIRKILSDIQYKGHYGQRDGVRDMMAIIEEVRSLPLSEGPKADPDEAYPAGKALRHPPLFPPLRPPPPGPGRGSKVITGYKCNDCANIWNREPVICPACDGVNVEGGPPQERVVITNRIQANPADISAVDAAMRVGWGFTSKESAESWDRIRALVDGRQGQEGAG